MKYWFLRVFEPAKNKGDADKLIFAVNYSELEDLLDIIRRLHSQMVKFGYKLVVTLKEFNFEE